MMAQALKFREHGAQGLSARRLDFRDRFDGLTEGQAMREGGSPREPLGKQQRAVNRLAFGDFFNAPVFIEEPLNRVDHVLADGLQ